MTSAFRPPTWDSRNSRQKNEVGFSWRGNLRKRCGAAISKLSVVGRYLCLRLHSERAPVHGTFIPHSTPLHSDRHLMQLALTAFSSTPRKSTAFVVASVLRHFFLQCGPSERGGRWRRGRARSGPHLILWARLPRGRFQGCCPFPQFHRENEFINLEKSLFTGFDSRAL